MMEPPLPHLFGPLELPRRVREARSALRLSQFGLGAFVFVTVLEVWAILALTDQKDPFHYWSDAWQMNSRIIFFLLTVGGFVFSLLGFVSGVSKWTVPQGKWACIVGGTAAVLTVLRYWGYLGIL